MFEYRQALEIRDAFSRHGVKYLFLEKSAAILLGFPDTTQDVDIFPLRSRKNGKGIVHALGELGFILSDSDKSEIESGKDFVQLKNGPFDIDLIFAPDGIDEFSAAWSRHLDIDGFPVCNIDDVIASKKSANRAKDRETLPRLIAFRDWLRESQRMPGGEFH